MISIPLTSVTGDGYGAEPLGYETATGEVRVVVSESESDRVTVVLDVVRGTLLHERDHHLNLPVSGCVRIYLGDYDDWQAMEDFAAARRLLGPLAEPLGFPALATA